MNPATDKDVDLALSRLGNYRVLTAQHIALEGAPDDISGALLLSLGMRETWLQNINNPEETDHGCFQISELYHGTWLASQPGVKAGTWRIASGVHSARDDGYCPRYTPACLYACQIIKDYRQYAIGKKINDPIVFACAAYNAGLGGAIAGYREGDIDRYTTNQDYSSWVIDVRSKVNHWLGSHPGWVAS